MKKAFLSVMFLGGLFFQGAAMAAEGGDLAACSALRDEAAYKKIKQEPYTYLVPGGDGWIFRTQNDMQSNFMPPPQSMRWYKDVRDALKAKGTDLVMLLIPTRGMAASQYVPASLPPGVTFDLGKAQAAYLNTADAFRKIGIPVASYDLNALKPEFFQKTDHHWSVAGARAGAELVAEAVKKLPSYAEIEKRPFETKDAGTYEYDPSFNRVISELCDVTLPKITDRKVTTAPKDAAKGAADLFGDQKEPQIALVGTSNSKANELFPNFDGALEELLSADVYNAAVTGGGMDDSIQSYMTSGAFARQKPKVIIWEIPVYYLDSDFREMFEQLLPGIAGDCADKAALKSEAVTVDGEDVKIMSGISGVKLEKGEKSWLVFDFSDAPKKSFGVAFRNAGGVDVEKFKFKRSKRYPKDGRYYLALDPEKQDQIDSVSVLAPDKMLKQKLTVQTRLCRAR